MHDGVFCLNHCLCTATKFPWQSVEIVGATGLKNRYSQYSCHEKETSHRCFDHKGHKVLYVHGNCGNRSVHCFFGTSSSQVTDPFTSFQVKWRLRILPKHIMDCFKD